MTDYVIEPKEEGKGRSFLAKSVILVTADLLWPEGADGKTIRPVWAVFAGTEQELRPFAANLRIGRKLQKAGETRGGDGERLEFLRSVGFSMVWQREPEGTLLTVYHPEIFRIDPGLIDPSGVKFMMLVPTDWAEDQRVDVTTAVRHVQPLAPKVEAGYLSSLVPTAYLFAAMLDRRTRTPLVADGRFYLQLLVASLGKGFASLPGSDIKYNNSWADGFGQHQKKHGFNIDLEGSRNSDRRTLAEVGIQHVISFAAAHKDFEEFVAEQVAVYFSKVQGDFRPVTEQLDFSSLLGASNG